MASKPKSTPSKSTSKPKKASPAKASPAKASPAKEQSATTADAHTPDEYTDYGIIERVPFGLLDSSDNVRRIRKEENQAALNESIKTGKAQERITGHWNADRTRFLIDSGSRRHLALKAAGYPTDKLIEVSARPAPRDDVEHVTRGYRANEQAALEWPDKVFAIGVAAGVIDRATGQIFSLKETHERRVHKLALTSKEAAPHFSMSWQMIDLYCRAARAPYDDLVRIYEAGGSLMHGEVYAKYPPEQRAEMLEYYLANNNTFPVEQPPPRQKMGGRPRKEEAPPAPPLAALARSEGAARRATQMLAEAAANAGPKQRPAPPAGPAIWSDDRQRSMFDQPPPTRVEPAPAVDTAQPVDERIAGIAARLGISDRLAELLDAASCYWQGEEIEQWADTAVDEMQKAIRIFRGS